MKLKFQKWDILAVAAVLCLAALVLLLYLPQSGQPAAYAEVYQNGALVKRVSLSQNTTFPVTGAYTNTVTVENGRIAVTGSDCPGADCVGCGWQDRSGRSIVCLPNGLEIRVVSAGGVDFVVG